MYALVFVISASDTSGDFTILKNSDLGFGLSIHDPNSPTTMNSNNSHYFEIPAGLCDFYALDVRMS